MLQIMDIEETYAYLKENLYEYDSYLLPIDAAVKLGLIIPVPSRKDLFIPKESEDESGITWHINRVEELTDEEMKEKDLYCRYRYESEAVETPAGYGGSTLIRAGFNL